MILLFAFYVRYDNLLNKTDFRRKDYIFLSIVSVILIILFTLNKDLRGGDTDAESSLIAMRTNKDSFMFQNLPLTSSLFLSLSGYFVFGIYFISLCTNFLWFNSIEGFLAFVLPNGVNSFGYADSSRQYICENEIYCGATWNPDMVIFIDRFGFPLFMIIVWWFGRFTSILMKDRSNKKNGVLNYILLFFIFLSLFSLPVGNFVFASSANIFSVFFYLIIYMYLKMNNRYY